jgi:hypothetical protein
MKVWVKPRGNKMTQLIESNEFGDWLLGEIAQTRAQLRSVNPDLTHKVELRLEALKTAKKTLREYLTLQQDMLEAASAALRPGRTLA